MSIDQAQPIAVAQIHSAMLRQFEVEQFLYTEAALLDAHRYEEWLDLFTDDTHYFMPLRRTRSKRELKQEFTSTIESLLAGKNISQLASVAATTNAAGTSIKY